MVKVLKNAEHKGIEIYFDNIPNNDIMQKLKELKFKWHRIKNVGLIRQMQKMKNLH